MITFYQLLHVIGAILLTAFTILSVAIAGRGKNKRLLMVTGILSLAVLAGGFGLVARLYGNTFEPWVHPKILCWLVISLSAGMAFRRPSQSKLWGGLTVIAVATAVAMVYVRPF